MLHEANQSTLVLRSANLADQNKLEPNMPLLPLKFPSLKT